MKKSKGHILWEAENELAGYKMRIMRTVEELIEDAVRSNAFCDFAGEGTFDEWLWQHRGLLGHWIFSAAHAQFRLSIAEKEKEEERLRKMTEAARQERS